MSVDKLLNDAKNDDIASFKENYTEMLKSKILQKIEDKRTNLFKAVSDK